MPSGHTPNGSTRGWGGSGYENYNCYVCGEPWHAMPGSASFNSQLCGACYHPNNEWIGYVRSLEAMADYVDTLTPTELKEDTQ